MARKSRKITALEADVQNIPVTNNKIYRTALYARLSIEDCNRPGSDTIKNQVELIKEYIEANPNLILVSEYIDNGISGTSFDRPEFARMMADMRAGEINCVIVKDFSRFGRNYLEIGDYLEKIFPFFGVRFISVTDNYDSENPNATADGLIIPLKNLINEAYSKDLSKKVSTSFELRQTQGKYVGSHPPYGYVKDPLDKSRLIIDEEVCGIVKRIFEYKASGLGNAKIANILNTEGVPSPMRYKFEKGRVKNASFEKKMWVDNTIAFIIVNPVYVGDMEQRSRQQSLYMGIKKHNVKKEDRIYVPDTHEPIISRELFDKVQRIVAERKQTFKDARAKNSHIKSPKNKFDHIIFCGDCGVRMAYRRSFDSRLKNKKPSYIYVCPNSNAYGEKYCKKKMVSKKVMETAVEMDLRLHIRLFLNAKELLQKLNKTAAARKTRHKYTQSINETKSKLERARSIGSALYNDYAGGVLSERDYLFAKQKYLFDEENLTQKLVELTAERETYEPRYTENRDYSKLIEKFADFSELNADVIGALINRITVVSKTKIEIEYSFDDELKKLIELTEKRKAELF